MITPRYHFQRQTLSERQRAVRRECWQNLAYHAAEAGFSACVFSIYLLAAYGLFDLIRRAVS